MERGKGGMEPSIGNLSTTIPALFFFNLASHQPVLAWLDLKLGQLPHLTTQSGSVADPVVIRYEICYLDKITGSG